jgi:hypothetical protein
MPRLTNHQYLTRRTKLHAIWVECNIAYSAALLPQQGELHRCYQTIVDLPDGQLIANREALDKAEPSLPHRAGKTYAAVVQAADYYQARAKTPVQSSRSSPKTESSRSDLVARPEPDLKKLAFALKLLAEQHLADQDDEPKAAWPFCRTAGRSSTPARSR